MIDEQQERPAAESKTGDSSADDPVVLAAENARLRALVGPDEQSYQDLRDELRDAAEAVRTAQAANGELRGQVMELTVALGQARHNMGKVSRIMVQRSRRVVGRLIRPVRRRLDDRRS